MQRELFFDQALLPSGWARDVRITVADGTIVAVAQGAPRAGADHVPGIAVPGLPKPMAPVAGRPFLAHQMDFWIGQGVRRFILAVGYRHEAIRAELEDRAPTLVFDPYPDGADHLEEMRTTFRTIARAVGRTE